MTAADRTRLFDAGLVVRSFGALTEMIKAGVSEWSLIERHQRGDFGEAGERLQRANARALRCGGRIFSVYRIGGGQTVWVISEPQGSQMSTTLMLPADRARRRGWIRAAHPASPPQTPAQGRPWTSSR
jgi:hypothetical protein